MIRTKVRTFIGVIAALMAAYAQQHPAPVVHLDGKPVFDLIAAPSARYGPDERAQIIQHRLVEFAESAIALTEVRIEEVDGATDVIAGDRRLVTVTDADAAFSQRSRADIAEGYVSRIRVAVRDYRDARKWQKIARSALITFGLVAGYAAVIFLLWRVRARFRTWVRSGPISVGRSGSLASLTRTFAGPIQSFVFAAETVVRWAIVVLLANACLAVVLSLYPGTEGTARELTALEVEPLKDAGRAFLVFLPNLFFLIVIAVCAWAAMRTADILFEAVGQGSITFEGFHSEWAEPTARLIRVLIFLSAVVIAYPYLPGADSPAFKGISVLIGVLLSIGSSSAVSNAVSGTILVYTRAFRPGDRIRTGETTGDVLERTLFVTRIRTIKNEVVTVPNSTLLSSAVTNYSEEARTRGLILHTEVTIGYDAPWKQVHDLLIEAARATPMILSDPAPFVLQTSLNDFHISYQLNAYTQEANRMIQIYSGLHQNIQDAFNRAGVEIMSPGYTALRDGRGTTIPESSRAAGS